MKESSYCKLKTLIAILAFFFFSCGIEDIYYLPQVSSPDDRSSNFGATINIPATHLSGLSYASGYRIYYRIYLSNELNVFFPDNTGLISSFVNDYNALWQFENPLNTTSITNFNTFSNRRYHELDYQIGRNGGTLFFWFPNVLGEIPTIRLNDGLPVELIRSSLLREQVPNYNETEKFFLNTDQLNDNANAISTFNADVAPGQGNTSGHAYVSMYIVAVGINPITFHEVYSKPTFISLFKLPNIF